MNDQSPLNQSVRTVPLHTLHLSPLNPRQDHDADDIAALAEFLKINGIMQNLNVFEGPDGLGVVAGGRRLRALELLTQAVDHEETDDTRQLIDFDAIPINVTSDEMMARSWAGAEGATQRPLHPAEEIRAYAAMADQGSTPDRIAAAFGQTRAHVMRRLKLASLSTEALDALRRNLIPLDVAQVLTMVDAPDRQHDALMLATDRNYNAGQLRRQLMEGNVPSDDRRVVFIGLDLYRAEGGTLDEDLFTDQSRLHNADLIDSLFKEKLTKKAEDLQASAGVARVVPIFDYYVGYQHTNEMRTLFRKPVELPEADQARYDALCEKGNEVEFTKAEAEEFDALEERMKGDFDTEEYARSTLFVYVNTNGKIDVSRPYLAHEKHASSGADDGAGAVAAKPPVTQTGIADLRIIQRAALQTEMLKHPELALDLLAFQLSHDLYSYSGPFNVTPTDQDTRPSSLDEVHLDERLQSSISDIGGDVEAAFRAFQEQGKKHRNTVLTQALVRTMNQPFGSPINLALMTKLGVSPRSIWTPTAENFFKACRSELLDSIWRKLACAGDEGGDQMERFAKLKVGEKRAELEALFTDASTQEALLLTRDQVAAIDAWLPDEIAGDAA
jgi:ParB family transcriptional regulator, chromosome partitioning protein